MVTGLESASALGPGLDSASATASARARATETQTTPKRKTLSTRFERCLFDILRVFEMVMGDDGRRAGLGHVERCEAASQHYAESASTWRGGKQGMAREVARY